MLDRWGDPWERTASCRRHPQRFGLIIVGLAEMLGVFTRPALALGAFGSLNIFFMGGRAGNLHFDLNSLMLVFQVAALAMGAGQTYAIDAWMRNRAQPRELTAT